MKIIFFINFILLFGQQACGSEQKTITYPKDRSLSEYVKYHGETRNGEPNGNGTMEYKNGDTYVGEWEYGKRNGTGTLNFNKKDERDSYSGDWRADNMTGNGTLLWKDGSKYDGQFDNGLKNGFGKHFYSKGATFEDTRSGNGTEILQDGTVYAGNVRIDEENELGENTFVMCDIYEGGWKNDLKSGNGTLRSLVNATEFVGEWENDFPHGFGKFTYDGVVLEGYWNGLSGNGTLSTINGTYEGEFEDLIMHGIGKLTTPEIIFEGQWKHGEFSGNGTVSLISGAKFFGEFQDFLLNGFGNITDSNGLTKEGQFKQGELSGFGTIIILGNKYEGDFENDFPNGKGSLVLNSGDYYVGEFEVGLPNGKGKYTFMDGEIIENGTYIFRNGTKSVDGKIINDKLSETFGKIGELLNSGINFKK